jgi:hypothetical protein
MLRGFWSRPAAALFAVWLALVMGDVGFVHPHCAMHDGALPAHTTGAMNHGSGAHDAGAISTQPLGDRDAPPTGHGPHLCSCVGACSATGGAEAIGGETELPQTRVTAREVAVPAANATWHVRPRAPFSLPFPHGPPSAIA